MTAVKALRDQKRSIPARLLRRPMAPMSQGLTACRHAQEQRARYDSSVTPEHQELYDQLRVSPKLQGARVLDHVVDAAVGTFTWDRCCIPAGISKFNRCRHSLVRA